MNLGDIRRAALERLLAEDTGAERGKKQRLANRLGRSSAQLSQWLSGYRTIGERVARDIERRAAKPPRWLDQLDQPSESGSSNVREAVFRGWVPLVSWVCAGEFRETPEECAGDDPEMVGVLYSAPGPRAFALTVEGDSMTAPAGAEPSFPPGMVIVVDPDRASESGDYVVARTGVGFETTFKRLMRDAGRWYLRPLNTGYPTLEITDRDTQIVGRVIETLWRRRL